MILIPLRYILLKGLAISLILGSIACSSKNEVVISQPTLPDPQGEPYYWDDIAELLAGVPLQPNSRFHSIAAHPRYIGYCKRIRSYWAKEEKNYLQVVIPWRDSNIEPLQNTNTTLYLLSGADYINLYHFHPDSPKYIMVGLQIPGHISDPRELKIEHFLSALPNFESLIYELSHQNYYTSKRLERNSKNKYISGVAPVLLIFLKKLGFTIADFSQVSIDENGGIAMHTHQSFEREEPIPGIKISYFKKGDSRLRELYFFRIYLTGESTSPSTREGKFFSRENRLNLIFKSAEYILHTPEYEEFNKILLTKADRIIEDESGIPIRLISQSEWDIRVFGRYSGRMPLKKTPKVPHQSDLSNLYTEQNPDVLPFHFGYGVLRGKGKSNLIFLKRKLQEK